MSEGTFREIDREGERGFGPAAVLLCGFAGDEARRVSELLRTAGAPEHRVILCTEAMVQRTLGEVLETPDDSAPLPPEKLPRVMILSGLSGRQIHAVLDGYDSTGVSRPIFGATTPGNLRLTVRDLLVELLREQRAMSQRR